MIVLIGFVASIFSFALIAGFFWQTLPKWLSLEEEYRWTHEPTEEKPSRIKQYLGYLYMIVALPIGWAIGAGVAIKVFHLVTERWF